MFEPGQVVAVTAVSKCLCRSRDPYFDAPLGSSDGGGIRRFPSGLTPISELTPTGSISSASPLRVLGQAQRTRSNHRVTSFAIWGSDYIPMGQTSQICVAQLGVEGAGFDRQGVISARRPALRLRLQPHGVRPSRTRTRNKALRCAVMSVDTLWCHPLHLKRLGSLQVQETKLSRPTPGETHHQRSTS